MGKSKELATLKDDGGTFKSSLVIDTGTNGIPSIDFKHANALADQFRLQAGTPCAYLYANDYIEVFRFSTVNTTTRTFDWSGNFSGYLIG